MGFSLLFFLGLSNIKKNILLSTVKVSLVGGNIVQ